MNSRLARFSLVFVGTSLAIPLAIFVVQLLLKVDLSSSGAGMIPFMIAAMVEGQRYVKDFGEKPTPSEMWKAARFMALIGMIWSLVLAIVYFVVLMGAWDMLAQISPVFMLVAVVVLYGIALLTCRVFVWLGANNQLKQTARKRG